MAPRRSLRPGPRRHHPLRLPDPRARQHRPQKHQQGPYLEAKSMGAPRRLAGPPHGRRLSLFLY